MINPKFGEGYQHSQIVKNIHVQVILYVDSWVYNMFPEPMFLEFTNQKPLFGWRIIPEVENSSKPWWKKSPQVVPYAGMHNNHLGRWSKSHNV